jgi:hypothetical protein
MNDYMKRRFLPGQATNCRAQLGIFALILACFVVLSIAGCTGLTGAGTVPAKTNSASPSPGTLVASATALNFGNVAAGSSSPQTLTLSNSSTSIVTISQATVTGSGFSVVGGVSSVTIAAGQNLAIQIQFAPSSAGSVSGSLSILSDATDSNLAISLNGTGMARLAITTQPASESVVVGQTATFSVAATGMGALTYQWKKGGTAIGGATSASYTTPGTATADSGAQFTVVVTDSNGSLTSNAATLTVTLSATAPSITTQPASETVSAGQTATFKVTAAGTSPFTYQWVKNGAAISGATSASYTTSPTVASDNNAQFCVTVTNSVTSVTSNNAVLAVNLPPTISSQPSSQTVAVGQSATFSVTATGVGTLTYQWKKNGVAISGATSSSYTTPAATTASSGQQFSVTVSNGAGSVTSNAANLTVNGATLVLTASTASLNFSSVNIGSNSSLPVIFTNGGNSSVTISNVTISGAGYTASGVSSGQIVAPGHTATLNVTFAPAGTGSLPGKVTVTSNATNSPASITLSGTGVQSVSHSVALTWTSSVSLVSGYNAYRSTVSGGPYTKLNSTPVAPTTYTDTAVQAGQTYFYVATSVDSSGIESADSTEVSAIVP